MNIEYRSPQLPDGNSLEALASAIPLLIWMATPDGRVTHLNHAAQKLFGIIGDGLLGHDWINVLHPDDRAMVVTVWRRAQATAAPLTVEFRAWRHPDGWRRCLAQALPLCDASGAILQWVGSTSDIEELHRRTEALTQSQAMCRTALEWLPDFLLLLDGDGKILEGSRAALEAVGVSRDAVLGLAVDQVIENLSALWSSTDSAANRHKELESTEVVIRGTNGRPRQARVSLHWRLAQPGLWLGFLLVEKSAAQTTRAASRLLEISTARRDWTPRESSYYRELLQCLPNLAWAVGPTGLGEFANQRWFEYTGLNAAEIAGLGWMAAFHPEDRAIITAEFARVVHNPRPVRVEVRMRRHDGVYRRFDIMGEPILDARGNLARWVGASTDIEARYALQNSLGESELRFGQLISQLPDSFLLFDVEARVLEANATACATLDCDRARLLGRSLLDFLAPDATEFFTRLEVAADHGEPQRLNLRTASGGLVPVSATFGRQVNEGRSAYFLLARDLSAQEAAARALQSQARMIDLAPLAMCNLDGHVTLWSEGMERLLGFAAEEALDQPMWTLLQAAPADRLRSMLRQLKLDGRCEGELEVTHKQGRTLQMRMLWVLGGDEDLPRIIMTCENSSPTRLDDTQRRGSAEAARQVHDMVGEFRWDIARQEVTLDYAAQVLCGIKNPQMEARMHEADGARLIWQGDRGRSITQLNEARRNNRAVEVEFRATLDTKLRWLMFRAVPSADGMFWRARMVDITARSRARDALEASQRDLRAYAHQLNRTLEQERASIARELHDELGQRLTVLRLDLQRLGSRLAKDDAASADVTEQIRLLDGGVKEALDQMRYLSAQLRPESMESLGLKSSMEAHATRVGAASPLRIKLLLGRADLVPLTQRLTIFRIFQEALTNVLRHSGATEAAVQLRLRKDFVELQVRDNGCGLPPERSRSGLGIVGMRERAHALGGMLLVEGGPQGGTTVTLRLPREVGRATASRRRQPARRPEREERLA